MQQISINPHTAPPFSFNQPSRQELVQVLLSDLRASTNQGTKSRLTPKGPSNISTIPFLISYHILEAAQALLAVKTLGKQPAGSQYISAPSNLSTLLALSTAFKDDPDASLEALRCVANALLLIEAARTTWVAKEVRGGGACVELLEVSHYAMAYPTTSSYVFPRNLPLLIRYSSLLAYSSSAPVPLGLPAHSFVLSSKINTTAAASSTSSGPN